MPNARDADHKTGILSASDTAGPLVLALEVSFNSGIGDGESALVRSFGRYSQHLMPVEKHLGISGEPVAKAEVRIREVQLGIDSPPSSGKCCDCLGPILGVVENLAGTQTGERDSRRSVAPGGGELKCSQIWPWLAPFFAQIGPVLHCGVVPMVFVTEGSFGSFPIFQITRCVEQFQEGAPDTRGPVREPCQILVGRHRRCLP